MRIRIIFETTQVTAQLDDTPAADALCQALPLESVVHTWGDEVYFGVPVSAELEPGAREVVEPGTVCFWTEGNSLAIPFGPTPVSQGTECRLVFRVNVLGQLEGDPCQLAEVREGTLVRVERAD